MASIIETVRNSRFVYFGFNPQGEDADIPWLATPLICVSEDGIHWDQVAELPELGNLRDGYIKRINGNYWIIGTLQMFRTTNFKDFEPFDLDILKQPQYRDIWAPEFVFDHLGKQWKIVYSANDSDDNQSHIYFANFDPDTGKVSAPYQKTNVSGEIDPDIIYLNRKYILVVSQAKFYVSDNLMGPYTELKTNIDNVGARWFEAPSLLVVGDQLFLYQDKINGKTEGVADSGDMVYAQANISDLTKWTPNHTVESLFNMRHGSFMIGYQDSEDPEIIQSADAVPKYADDPIHVNTVNPVDLDSVDPRARTLANDIRRKRYGRDVREILARSVEWVSEQLTKLCIKIIDNSKENVYLRKRFENAIHGLTKDSEVIDARMDGNGVIFSTLKGRLDSQQVNYGQLGDTLKVDISDELMIVKGLSENSKGLHYEVVRTDAGQKIHSGAFTIELSQLTIKDGDQNGGRD